MKLNDFYISRSSAATLVKVKSFGEITGFVTFVNNSDGAISSLQEKDFLKAYKKVARSISKNKFCCLTAAYTATIVIATLVAKQFLEQLK